MFVYERGSASALRVKASETTSIGNGSFEQRRITHASRRTRITGRCLIICRCLSTRRRRRKFPRAFSPPFSRFSSLIRRRFSPLLLLLCPAIRASLSVSPPFLHFFFFSCQTGTGHIYEAASGLGAYTYVFKNLVSVFHSWLLLFCFSLGISRIYTR